ncbi:MAG: hypothetical protein VXY35_04870 [Candidatus Thermoplasmatota archaeon]|nr:hypothetical protein [Candidatus Thermoplasmatota archaeon]MEC8589465.1 hypothetical protein [Candidatus Thermoplasmatota archaeon]
MDWLEATGWSYDTESESIETVEYNSTALAMVVLMLFFSPFILFPLFTGNYLILFFTTPIVLGVSYLLAYLMTINSNVRRITLSDLSYTVMKRNKRTLENSKINTLESTARFTHENLEVVVVEYENLQGGGGEGGGGGGYVTQYQVRLVEKRLVGNERYFTHLGKRFLKTDQSTLHPDLRVEPRHLVYNHGNKQMKWNYGNDPAYDVQRMLVLKAKNKTHALELSERFREFFIEGGWKELTRQPSATISTEATGEDNRPFWE